MDILGEFYTQGKLGILISVLFLIAVLLLGLALVERKKGMIRLSH